MERLRIDTHKHLKIGSPCPVAKLEISYDGNVGIGGAAFPNGLDINGTVSLVCTNPDAKLELFSTGNIGMATMSPRGKLNIVENKELQDLIDKIKQDDTKTDIQ